MMAEIKIPTIHSNGTSRAELMAQLEAAHSALDVAIGALEQACPNGRDYYPQGAAAIQEALRQHANRLHNLTAVSLELRKIAEAIYG
jgi:queuine/archaeosine tRNA-ribosyltransferase